jgi:RNA polymerase sigma-70 factor (ECF subfamily)
MKRRIPSREAAMPRTTDSAELGPQQLADLRTDLLRQLSRRVRDPALAEDLTQEALLHVLRGLAAWRGAAGLRTWARTIALNVWRDHLRQRAASVVDQVGAGDRFSVAALLDAIGPNPAPGPEELTDRQATHECLVAATRRLPLAERQLVLLHDLAEMPIEQAATACGCSAGTAKVRLHRGRRRVTEICRADCESTPGADGTILCSPKRIRTSKTSGARRRRPVRHGRDEP